MGVPGWTSEHKRNLEAITASAMREARTNRGEWIVPLPLQSRIRYVGDYTFRFDDDSEIFAHDVYEIQRPDFDRSFFREEEYAHRTLTEGWYNELLKGQMSGEEQDRALELIMRLGTTLRARNGGW